MRTLKLNTKILFIFLLLFSSNVIFPQNLISRLDNYLNKYYENKNIPSISAGISSNDVVIWANTQGFADLENNVPAINESVYRIASISKSITAVAVMQLVEKGKIDLDEDVRKYIPYFPKKKWKFTTRELLNHTSGIRSYNNPAEFDSKEYLPTIKDAVGVLLKDTLKFKPGTKYHYSTLAYNLLAAIIENASGMTYEKYLQQNIFEPAKMTSTHFDFQKNIIKNRVHGYIKNEFRQFKNAPLADLSIKFPGGGILSNSIDLLHFADALIYGRLIKPATLDTMLVPSKLKNGTILTYGLGFGIGTDSSGKKYFFHSGAGTGFTSFLIIYPKEKLASVYLMNIRDRNLDNPALDLLSIVLGKDMVNIKKSAADELLQSSMKVNVDSAISEYNILKKDSSDIYKVGEEELNLFGNDLINIKNYVGSIKLFRFLTIEFPNNKDAFLGLANSYNLDGNRGLAIKNYKAVLKLEPTNSEAAFKLKKLIEF